MSRPERLLSLLSLNVPGWEVIFYDTSGQKITPQLVAAALAKVSPLAWAVARVKYAGADVEAVWVAHRDEMVSRAVEWSWKDGSPAHYRPGLLRDLVVTAAADCLANRMCLTCKGRIHEWPEHIRCAGCGRTGRREVKERERYRHLKLKKVEWEQRWKSRYEEICHEILNAHSEALRAVRSL